MSDEQIKRMVDRFLSWQIPVDFAPDGGISFEPFGNIGSVHAYKRRPCGTNLLTAAQAEQMVRYMLDADSDDRRVCDAP